MEEDHLMKLLILLRKNINNYKGENIMEPHIIYSIILSILSFCLVGVAVYFTTSKEKTKSYSILDNYSSVIGVAHFMYENDKLKGIDVGYREFNDYGDDGCEYSNRKWFKTENGLKQWIKDKNWNF